MCPLLLILLLCVASCQILETERKVICFIQTNETFSQFEGRSECDADQVPTDVCFFLRMEADVPQDPSSVMPESMDVYSITGMACDRPADLVLVTVMFSPVDIMSLNDALDDEFIGFVILSGVVNGSLDHEIHNIIKTKGLLDEESEEQVFALTDYSLLDKQRIASNISGKLRLSSKRNTSTNSLTIDLKQSPVQLRFKYESSELLNNSLTGIRSKSHVTELFKLFGDFPEPEDEMDIPWYFVLFAAAVLSLAIFIAVWYYVCRQESGGWQEVRDADSELIDEYFSVNEDV